MAERVHRNQRRVTGDVTEIVGENTAGELRTARRFNSDAARTFLPLQGVFQERKGNSGKVRSAAERRDDHVRVGVDHGKLLLRLLTNNGLVHKHMVEH